MNKKRIHDLDLIIDLSEISETDYLIVDDENEESSKKISVDKLFEIMNNKSKIIEKTANKGVPNGYAPLNSDGKLPTQYLYDSGITYGVSIDLTNSDPETSVTYTDDAVGMVPGSSWYEKDIFKDIRPCLFKNGAVVGYLNPNNFAQFADGTAADITSGNAGDVMIEIPKIGYRIAKNGTNLIVQITNNPNREDFSYLAHTRETEGDRDYLYVGAFLGSLNNEKLCSISGAEPYSNEPGDNGNYYYDITPWRDAAHSRGNGYDILSFYPLTLLQCLYLIMFKNLDCQAALGMGYVGNAYVNEETWEIENLTSPTMTGSTTAKGMNYGSEEDPLQQMKFLGMEDFWGNIRQYIDGIAIKDNGDIYCATDNFVMPFYFDSYYEENPDAAIECTGREFPYNYTKIGNQSLDNSLYMSEPYGTNEGGFLPVVCEGSQTTYFCDFSNISNGGIGYFLTSGGSCVHTDNYNFHKLDSGIFSFFFESEDSYDFYMNGYTTGARLMYL